MRILIEVPSYDGRISRVTSRSIWQLEKCGHVVDYKPRIGYGCDMARNRIAADAINARYDYVFMVDNDIELPKDALKNLLEHDADFVTGYYLNAYASGENQPTCVYKFGCPGWKKYTDEELFSLRESGEYSVRVKGCGFGCALIRTDVFRKIDFPWFRWEDFDFEERLVADVYECRDWFESGGEDIEFCLKCKQAGIEIILDTRVKCGHESKEVKWPK